MKRKYQRNSYSIFNEPGVSRNGGYSIMSGGSVKAVTLFVSSGREANRSWRAVESVSWRLKKANVAIKPMKWLKLLQLASRALILRYASATRYCFALLHTRCLCFAVSSRIALCVREAIIRLFVQLDNPGSILLCNVAKFSLRLPQLWLM